MNSIFAVYSADAVMPIPTGKQAFSYPAIVSPGLSDTPSEAKPLAVGSVATGGNTLSIKIGLNKLNASVDIYGAFVLSTNPNVVNVLNPDGKSFKSFTITQILNAISTGIPPNGAQPWKEDISSSIDEHLFDLATFNIPQGTYSLYLLVTSPNNLSSYYLWITSFVISAPPTDMVLVPGGCFQMGDNFGDGDFDEIPVHEVCLAGFYMDTYQVTQGKYQSVIGNNPSFFQGDKNRPVEQVSWYNARDYCQAVDKRLPTEAEWEYAARSGGKLEKWAGTNTESSVGNYAWYNANSGDITHPVGQKQPNGLGLYDMSGNLWEWVADWYDEDYYSISPKNNPQGPDSGSDRVIRGGCWCDNIWSMRTTYRLLDDPDNSDRFTGFRCAR
jgi:formylglycine-generating enzyme required for sulfatase activity